MGGIRRQHASRRSPEMRIERFDVSQANVSAKVKLAFRVDATCEIGQGETVRSHTQAIRPEKQAVIEIRALERVFVSGSARRKASRGFDFKLLTES